MRNYETNYHFEPTTGESICVIFYDGQVFAGHAYCHPEDSNFVSERVGLTIAESRATIRVLKYIKRYEIIPQLKILKHLHTNMKTSKYHNPHSYEAMMLRSQIRVLENELAAINNEIATETKFLKDYIEGKGKLYKRLRDKNQ